MPSPTESRPARPPGGGVRGRPSERVFLTAFLLLLVAGLAFVSVDELGRVSPDQRSAARLAVAAAWLLSAGTVAGLQFSQHRRGALIVRDPARRAENQKRLALSARVAIPIAVGGAVVLGVLGHAFKAVVAGLFGGAALAFVPTLLWIAFALRPDENRGEPL